MNAFSKAIFSVLMIWLAATPAPAQTPLPFGATTRLAVAPNNPLVLAAAIQSYIWVSVDGGSTWHITGRLVDSDAMPQPVDSADIENESPTLSGDSNDAADESNTTVADAGSSDDAESFPTADTDGATNSPPLLLAVSNAGDVVFWQRHTRRVTFCSLTAACFPWQYHANVTDIALDDTNTLWMATPNAILGYADGRQTTRISLAGAVSFLFSDSGQMHIIAPRGIYGNFASSSQTVSLIHSIPNVTAAAFFGNRLLVCAGGTIREVTGDGAMRLRQRYPGTATALRVFHGNLWIKRDRTWYVASNAASSAAGKSAATATHAPWRQMVDVLDVAVTPDASGTGESVWLGTTTGPQRWQTYRTNPVSHATSACRETLFPKWYFPTAIPADLPRPDSPWRTWLPIIGITAAYRRAAPYNWTPNGIIGEGSFQFLSAGIFLRWQRYDAVSAAIAMHSRISQQRYRQALRHARAVALIQQHIAAFCSSIDRQTPQSPSKQLPHK